MRNSILTSDLHLTSAPRDEYRWGLFNYLRDEGKRLNVEQFFILGDLTDAKDYHPSVLVNRVVAGLHELSQVATVYVLMGNHDGIIPGMPFFRFLDMLPEVHFIFEPSMGEIGGRRVVFLPHTREPDKAWPRMQKAIDEAHYCFLHATMTGACSETGQKLEGASTRWFSKCKGHIYSGDIHVPQRVGPVEYIGSPYHVRFGDKFDPRILHLDKKRVPSDLSYPAPSRRVFDVSSSLELAKQEYRKGDQVKIRFHLGREEYGDWHRYKEEAKDFCKNRGLDLCAVELCKKEEKTISRSDRKRIVKLSPKTTFNRYCLHNKIDDKLADAGRALLED
jgi:hypothetical protein